MLKTMLWQGALAALLVGGAAAGYAQVRDTGYLVAPAGEAKPAQAGRDGDKDKRKARHGEGDHHLRRAERDGHGHD